MVFNLECILGTFLKKLQPSLIVIDKTSEIDFPLYLISNVSLLNLFPKQLSHLT